MLCFSGELERCLGSEGEDEGSVWGMEVLDSTDAQDKVSLTPSEGTEPGSPVPCAESWADTETTPLKIPAADPEHCKSLQPALHTKQRLQLKPKTGFYRRILFRLQNRTYNETSRTVLTKKLYEVHYTV